MVNGVLYSTAGSRRAVIALDAGTGELLWTHSEKEGKRGDNAARALSGRGLAYWSDGTEERILYVTPGYRLIALNARTGLPVPAFGSNGIVDLKLDDDQDLDLDTADIGLHATPVVAGNTVIVGAAHVPSGSPRVKNKPKATFVVLMSGPANAYGFSTLFPKPANLAVRHGWMNPRITSAIPECGARSASMKNSDWSIFQSNCPRATYTGGIVRGMDCLEKVSSRWI